MNQQFLQGDCLEILKTMPDNSIHCCVTSPPYYNLRDYGVEGQVGLENSPDEFVDKLVIIFKEVWKHSLFLGYYNTFRSFMGML